MKQQVWLLRSASPALDMDGTIWAINAGRHAGFLDALRATGRQGVFDQ